MLACFWTFSSHSLLLEHQHVRNRFGSRKTNMQDYGLNPSVWGYAGWKLLHSVVFGLPTEPSKEQQDAVVALVASLQYLLPCSKCRANLASKIGIIEFYMIEKEMERLERIKNA